MHPNIRANTLVLNILPTLFLAIVLSKLPTLIIQRGTDRHLRARLAATPPIIHERRLPRHRRSAPYLSSLLTQPDALPWLAARYYPNRLSLI